MPTAIEFDFDTKRERVIPADDVRRSCDAGLFCWIDIDATADRDGAMKILRDLGVNEHAVEEALGPDVDGRFDLYDDCLHLAATSGTMRLIDDWSGAGAQEPAVPAGAGDAPQRLVPSHVDIVVGERFLVTLRRGQVDFIEEVRKHYRQDFLKFAKTSSFLLYEYCDYLIDSYKKTLRAFEARVEAMRSRIFGDVDDTIFAQVDALTRDLLAFRKITQAAREMLHELSTRRTPFVAESSQPFLDRLAGTLERLGADLDTQREILSETLNLYMGIVSHRTNKVVSRLTVISIVFLPLTFLCGVYGMNFNSDKMMPELNWEWGYTAFWITAITIAASLLTYMKRKGWW